MVDEPEIQGRIAGSNVTSDIYALAVTNIVSVLSILAFPENMPDELAVGMLKGFGDFCREMGAPVVGGHTIQEPLANHRRRRNRRRRPEKIVYTRGAKVGDRLFLTKAAWGLLLRWRLTGLEKKRKEKICLKTSQKIWLKRQLMKPLME